MSTPVFVRGPVAGGVLVLHGADGRQVGFAAHSAGRWVVSGLSGARLGDGRTFPHALAAAGLAVDPRSRFGGDL